jgi:hypothetical protein
MEIESAAVIPTNNHSVLWDTKHKALMGNGEKIYIAERSTYVVHTNTFDWDMQHAKVNVRIAHYNLQDNFTSLLLLHSSIEQCWSLPPGCN